MTKIRLCVLVTTICHLAAQHQVPESMGTQSGARSFRMHCSACHGRNAQGGQAPDLTMTSHSDTEIYRIISHGVPGTPMAGYETRLPADEIQRIVAFLRSANRDSTQLRGDAMRGETLFWSKGNCGKCHGIGMRGNRIGPDLSEIGSQRSIPFLRESMTAPSAVVAQGYTTLRVVTQDGKTVRGIERTLDDFNAILMDLSGTIWSFDRASLRFVERNTESLMPAAGDVLTPSEVEDVLAYLWTLKGDRAGIETR